MKCKSTLDSGLLFLLFFFLLLFHSLLTSWLPGRLDIQVPCRCPITGGWGRSCTTLLAKIPPRHGAKQCNHIQEFYNLCCDCWLKPSDLQQEPCVTLCLASRTASCKSSDALSASLMSAVLFVLSLGAPPNLMVWDIFSHVFLWPKLFQPQKRQM